MVILTPLVAEPSGSLSIAKDYKNYAGYQTKTTREIPVVILTPA